MKRITNSIVALAILTFLGTIGCSQQEDLLGSAEHIEGLPFAPANKPEVESGQNTHEVSGVNETHWHIAQADSPSYSFASTPGIHATPLWDIESNQNFQPIAGNQTISPSPASGGVYATPIQGPGPSPSLQPYYQLQPSQPQVTSAPSFPSLMKISSVVVQLPTDPIHDSRLKVIVVATIPATTFIDSNLIEVYAENSICQDDPASSPVMSPPSNTGLVTLKETVKCNFNHDSPYLRTNIRVNLSTQHKKFLFETGAPFVHLDYAQSTREASMTCAVANSDPATCEGRLALKATILRLHHVVDLQTGDIIAQGPNCLYGASIDVNNQMEYYEDEPLQVDPSSCTSSFNVHRTHDATNWQITLTDYNDSQVVHSNLLEWDY